MLAHPAQRAVAGLSFVAPIRRRGVRCNAEMAEKRRTTRVWRNGIHPGYDYPLALGGHPTGHKLREGDRRTPEGSYLLDHKEPAGKYYKSIRISYPNAYDRMLAQGRGAPPGEEVVIHGQRPAFEYLSPLTRKLDWTNGSIALSNRDMDKVWAAVDPGTPVEIKP